MSGPAFDRNFASVKTYDRCRDVQADSRAGHFSRLFVINAIERIKYARL